MIAPLSVVVKTLGGDGLPESLSADEAVRVDEKNTY